MQSDATRDDEEALREEQRNPGAHDQAMQVNEQGQRHVDKQRTQVKRAREARQYDQQGYKSCSYE